MILDWAEQNSYVKVSIRQAVIFKIIVTVQQRFKYAFFHSTLNICDVLSAGVNKGDGEVDIAFVFDCPCEFMCYRNYNTREFTCLCQPNWILAADGLTCIGECMRFKIFLKKSIIPEDGIRAHVFDSFQKVSWTT